MKALAEFWLSAFGISISFEHVFSCEIDEWRQRFIAQQWVPSLILEDSCEMGAEKCKDVLSGTYRAVADVHILFAGIE